MTSEGKEKTCRDLESLLQSSLGPNIIVEDCVSQNLLSLGENFASDMKKITAYVRQKKDSPLEEYHFVMKKIIDNDQIGDWEILIKREIFFYADLIPFFTKIELDYIGRKENRKTITEMVPKLYGYRISFNPESGKVSEDTVILLENIKVKGYYVVSKIKGLDLQHTKKAITMLAKFHALGIVAKKKYQKEFEKVKSVAIVPGFFNLHGTDDFRKRFISHVLKDDNRYNKNITIIEEIEKRHENNRNYEMTINDTWSTICHSDYWTNNLMFHADKEGNVDDMKFVDFQSFCFSNIFTDVCHFLCTSLDNNTYSHHFDEIIDLYYETFINELKDKKIEVENFSRAKFDEQFRKDASYELIHNLIALLYHTVDADNAQNVNDILQTIHSCKGNDVFHHKLAKVLKTYEDKNWLQ